MLAERGITPERRAALRAKVDLVLDPTPALAAPAPSADPAERQAKLVALKLWFDDWSGTARAYIKKRSHLIRLGLAHRRPSKAAAKEDLDA